MKEVKTAIIATIITIMVLISCACAMPAYAEQDRGEFYLHLTVVVASTRIESHLWIVDCRDKDGNVWSFFDDEGTWEKGDIANLLMWNMGEQEEDNEVIEVYWEGYTKDIDSFFQIEGWR